MAERETSRDIDQAASDWTARLDHGPLTPEQEHAYQAWLGGDPRSKGALLRAQALSMMSESARALGPGFDATAFEEPKTAPPPDNSRRKALIWAGGAVTGAALTALGIGLSPAAAAIRTGRGEIRLVPLKDGSTVLLNTESSIRVQSGADTRFVSLLAGEAYFSVARDDKRPFIVEVDGQRVRTTQAGFRIRKLDSRPVDVLVDRGRVDVDTTNGVVITANTRLLLSEGQHPQPIAPESVTRELSWREGKLAFEGETLEQAAATFARYSDLRIRIADPRLAAEPVTGLFAANDPMGFSRAVARIFDAKVEQRDDGVVLTRDAAPR
jgi:transmembrane sensor